MYYIPSERNQVNKATQVNTVRHTFMSDEKESTTATKTLENNRNTTEYPKLTVNY